eukprot:10077809-Karenia_brevis.AAC.1
MASENVQGISANRKFLPKLAPRNYHDRHVSGSNSHWGYLRCFSSTQPLGTPSRLSWPAWP